MRKAKIAYQGREFVGYIDNDDVLTDESTGQKISLNDEGVKFLPPCEGTMFALGLNYADHAAELEFKAPE